MNRHDFQALAIERLDDAQALLAAKRYSAAYYLAGYAIEFALKACIARKTREDDFPPKEAPRYYIHDLTKLADSAGLGAKIKEEANKNLRFEDNWTFVKDWTERTRYQSFGEQRATDFWQQSRIPRMESCSG
jgi:HEPN domain-containing protein